MNLKMLFVTVVLSIVGILPGYARDIALNIKTDVKGQYFLVEKTSRAKLVTLLVKRFTVQRSVYVKREFDCAANTVRYLGSGESMDEMEKDKADAKVYPIKKGSILDQLAVYACSRAS